MKITVMSVTVYELLTMTHSPLKLSTMHVINDEYSQLPVNDFHVPSTYYVILQLPPAELS